MKKWLYFVFCSVLYLVPALAEEKVILKQLRGIILVDKAAQMKTRPNEYPEGINIEIENISHKEKLKKQLGRFLNKQITSDDLEKIRKTILKFYREEGYPIVFVSIPSGQQITSSQFYILLIVGKIGQVQVEGARYFSKELLLSKTSLQPGKPIRTGPMMDALSSLNQNPFRRANLIYEKGNEFGETDLVFYVQDRWPFSIYGGYENTGNIVAGDSRLLSGLSWGNVFGLDHQLNYQFFTAPDLKEWWGTGGSYIAPLSRNHTLKVYGSYVQARPTDLEREGFPEPMSLHGKGWQTSGRYIAHLNSIHSWRHSLTGGYDFKRTNNFLAYSDALIFRAFIDVSQFVLSYDGIHENDSGMTTLGGTLFLSPGNMTAFNHTHNFQQERPGATSHYIYGRISLDRYTELPSHFSWMFSSLIQLTGNKLLPSEELSVGGFLSVRGYDENEIVSDRGIVIRNELRFPPFSIFKKAQDQLEFLTFVDFGYANDVDRNIFDKYNALLASVGPGVRYKIQHYLDFRFDYGFQLKKIKDRPFASNDRSRMHLGVILSY